MLHSHLEFYKDKEVRQRIAEYCGGDGLDTSTFTTARNLVGYGELSQEERIERIMYEEFIPTPERDSFNWILDKGLDIFRSVWDRENILGVLDLEYYNMDYPGEAYINQDETFKKLEPVYEAVLKVFYKFNINPLVIMTGQGYHFSSQIKQKSKACRELEKIGKVNNLLYTQSNTSVDLSSREVSLIQGKAYDGMGRLMEYLVHLIIKQVRKSTTIPVLCTDLAVGKGLKGREAISLDLSMYGDPLYMRSIRCPFSTYQKHKVEKHKVGDKIAREVPIQISLPRLDLSLEEMLIMRRNFNRASDYAKQVTTKIPDASLSYESLIKSYKHSMLYQFHKYFDKSDSNSLDYSQNIYEQIDLNILPPCIRHPLLSPNDHLLKPTNIQAITRVLFKLGWPPRRIVELIRSKYEENHQWGRTWIEQDTLTRASFYVRLFGGMIYDSTDTEEDLNCISHQEKGYCWQSWCGHNLINYKFLTRGS